MNRKERLEHESIPKLLMEFAIPSIIAMMVSSLYNIVDQFFIGRSIGELGNAATNIQFPLSISCTATALLFGIGGASAFNIAMGRSKFEPEEGKRAGNYMGNAAVMLFSCGVILFLITQALLVPMLKFFGSPENVLPYARTYTRIVSFGFPFLIFSIGGGHLLRADGRPNATMTCNLTGAILNTILDAVFIMKFHWGMAGAALATVAGQVIASCLVFYFLTHAKTVHLTKENLKVSFDNVKRIAALGTAQFSNQIAMMVVQIVMNNSLRYYGGQSIYGEAIPIACAGIITKVNMIFMSFIIGISQGSQPIISFNYGRRLYRRARKTYLLAISYGAVIAVIAFLLFQFKPYAIISIFGNGSPEYYEFAAMYFKVYLFFTFLNFLQPLSSNAYTAMGKPAGGTFLSLTRQIIFLLPLILILPLFMGIKGIMYAGPVADFLAASVCAVVMIREFTRPEYRKKTVEE